MRKFYLLFSLLFAITFAKAQDNYVNGQRISINIFSEATGFEIFDSAFKDKKVFFTGEDHRFITSNNNMSLAFTKYLNQKYGVKHLMLELGFTWGRVLNTYVQTGNEDLFELIKKSSYISHHDYFKALYEYNKDLPEDEKITITGIDVTRDFQVCIHYLDYLFPDSISVDDKITVSVESIKALSAYIVRAQEEKNTTLPYSYYNSVDSIIANFDRYPEIYEEALGENFEVYSKVIQCLKDNIVWNNYETNEMVQLFIFREQFMFEQFKKLLEEYPDDKFYGQFGRCHVVKSATNNECGWLQFRAIASRVRDYDLVKDKVVSIPIIYTEGLTNTDNLDLGIRSKIKRTPPNSIYAYVYDKDVLDFDSLDKQYDFVIIDKKSRMPKDYVSTEPANNLAKTKDKIKNNTVMGYEEGFFMLPLNGSQFDKLNRLNNVLDFYPLFEDFYTPIVANLFFIDNATFTNNIGLGFGFSYGKFEKQNSDLTPTSNIELGGYQSSIKIAAYAKYKSLWAQFGLKGVYQQYDLTYSYTWSSSTSLNGFSINHSTKLSSPVYSIAPHIGVSMTVLDLLYVGLEASYNIQASNTRWKENGSLIIGPSQRWDGFFVGYKLGIKFSDK